MLVQSCTKQKQFSTNQKQFSTELLNVLQSKSNLANCSKSVKNHCTPSTVFYYYYLYYYSTVSLIFEINNNCHTLLLRTPVLIIELIQEKSILEYKYHINNTIVLIRLQYNVTTVLISEELLHTWIELHNMRHCFKKLCLCSFQPLYICILNS